MKKIIAFATCGLDFNGNSLHEKALGGSESAMILMAKELAKLGNIVFVYCNCDRPGLYDGVLYLSIEEFSGIHGKRFDVLILSRYLEMLAPLAISNLTLFWMHDTYTDNFARAVHLTDGVYLMSEFQKALWVSANKHYEEMITVTRNGYDSSLAEAREPIELSNKQHAYIYASRPERGLELLLKEIWPKIIERTPQAYLHICSYDNPAKMPKETEALYARIESLITTSTNVVKLGALNKSQFYGALNQCSFMLYPCNFPEISCIAAIEAQAMGCVVVSTDAFALRETIKTNTLISEDYGTEEYVNAFVDKVFEYHNPELHAFETVKAKLQMYNDYRWETIAKQWDDTINLTFQDRFSRNKDAIARQLGYMSDYTTWQAIDGNFDDTIIESVKANNFSYDYFVSLADTEVNQLASINEIPGNMRQQMMINIASLFVGRNPNKKFTVLELGCYDGIISGGLYKKHAPDISQVYAYDGSADALAAYKEIWGKNPGCENITCINDNVTNLASHNLKADIIFVGELLEHLVDYKKTLEEIDACLNPGGLVVFSTPSGPWSWIELKENNKTYHEDFHLQHYELLDILTIFEAHQKENNFFVMSPPTQAFNQRGDACGHFVFGYTKNSVRPFQTFNPYIKAMKTRPYASISTCMIVKNEENNLHRCLNSVKGISDEIIIVDTGSTDRTKEIASHYTTKIYDLKWEEEDGIGSFERARNYSLDKANGDWIFYIDADEELKSGNELGNYVRSTFVKSFNILQKQILVEGENTHDQTPNRLFKRDVFRFYGVLHELPKQDPIKDNDILDLVLPKHIRLNHLGYLDSELRLSKILRNDALLQKNLQKYPDLLDNYLYKIRNHVHFYQFYKKVDFLYNALEDWENYPEITGSKKAVDAWLDTFVYVQIARKELHDNYSFNYIKRKGMHFATIKEYKLFKELMEIREILRLREL